MPSWKFLFALALLWILFSGKFDPFHLGLGVVSVALVAWLHKQGPSPDRGKPVARPFRASIGDLFRLSHYLLWLHLQIVKANLHVIYLALHPRMLEIIDPQVIRYRSGLKSGIAHFVLGNSITLTPGTVTIRITDDEYLVHAITPKAAGDMIADLEAQGETPAEMERRVAAVFERS